MVHPYCHFVDCFGFVFVGLFLFPLSLFISPFSYDLCQFLCCVSIPFSFLCIYCTFSFPIFFPQPRLIVGSSCWGSENNQQVPCLLLFQFIPYVGKEASGVQAWATVWMASVLLTSVVVCRFFQKSRLHFLVSLCFSGPEFLVHAYFSLYSSLVFDALGQVCSGPSTAALQQGSQIPGLSHSTWKTLYPYSRWVNKGSSSETSFLLDRPHGPRLP